ncbi:hypothetical protein ABXS75_10925 [Roseburia hominis]
MKKATEYQEASLKMKQLAARAHAVHQKAVEKWQHGEIQDVWFDQEGHLCIRYQDGMYWHYNERGEWW